MPELPEVETTRRGIEPLIRGKTVKQVDIRQRQLRWPVPPRLRQVLAGEKIESVNRRGKYLLLTTRVGTVIIHLGMSGSLRVVKQDAIPEKHDHVDIIFNNKRILRLRDPRRFGAVLWTSRNPRLHPLLKLLGPEPLSSEFNTQYLFDKSRNRKLAIKAFIMDSKIVVGVGNIYANEALFRAGIRPTIAAGRISKARYHDLVQAIKTVLEEAILQGGTTLRDFSNEQGKPGYFSQKLLVYGRAGEPCTACGTTIKQTRQNQRASFYCPQCQH
ncbi:bifunctional DNA-formamidopyrimidine glycosylase/DNA-(apurinic or apyrimidinic site) lyase [Kaarinaea lacus]